MTGKVVVVPELEVQIKDSLKQLSSSDYKQREKAVRYLIGLDTSRADVARLFDSCGVPAALRRVLDDNVPAVRMAAAEALTKTATGLNSFVGRITAMGPDEYERMREHVVDWFHVLATVDTPQVVETLRSLAMAYIDRKDTPWILFFAIEALGNSPAAAAAHAVETVHKELAGRVVREGTSDKDVLSSPYIGPLLRCYVAAVRQWNKGVVRKWEEYNKERERLTTIRGTTDELKKYGELALGVIVQTAAFPELFADRKPQIHLGMLQRMDDGISVMLTEELRSVRSQNSWVTERIDRDSGIRSEVTYSVTYSLTDSRINFNLEGKAQPTAERVGAEELEKIPPVTKLRPVTQIWYCAGNIIDELSDVWPRNPAVISVIGRAAAKAMEVIQKGAREGRQSFLLEEERPQEIADKTAATAEGILEKLVFDTNIEIARQAADALKHTNSAPLLAWIVIKNPQLDPSVLRIGVDSFVETCERLGAANPKDPTWTSMLEYLVAAYVVNPDAGVRSHIITKLGEAGKKGRADAVKYLALIVNDKLGKTTLTMRGEKTIIRPYTEEDQANIEKMLKALGAIALETKQRDVAKEAVRELVNIVVSRREPFIEESRLTAELKEKGLTAEQIAEQLEKERKAKEDAIAETQNAAERVLRDIYNVSAFNVQQEKLNRRKISSAKVEQTAAGMVVPEILKAIDVRTKKYASLVQEYEKPLKPKEDQTNYQSRLNVITELLDAIEMLGEFGDARATSRLFGLFSGSNIVALHPEEKPWKGQPWKEDPGVRAAAAEALSRMPAAVDDFTLNELMILAKYDSELSVRITALDSIARIGRTTPYISKEVAALLDDVSPDVRMATIRAVVGVGMGESMKDRIGEMLRSDSDIGVKIAAAQELLNLGKREEMVGILTAIALDRDEKSDFRAMALRVLGIVGPNEKLATKVKGLLNDRSADVRAAAVTVISKVGASVETGLPEVAVIDLIKGALDDREVSVRAVAIKVLAGLNVTAMKRKERESVIDGLILGLSDEDSVVAATAAKALKEKAPELKGGLAKRVDRALEKYYASLKKH